MFNHNNYSWPSLQAQSSPSLKEIWLVLSHCPCCWCISAWSVDQERKPYLVSEGRCIFHPGSSGFWLDGARKHWHTSHWEVHRKLRWPPGRGRPAMCRGGVGSFCQSSRHEQRPSAAPGLFLSWPALISTLWGTLSSVQALEAPASFVPLLAAFYASSCRRSCSPAFCRSPLRGSKRGLHSLKKRGEIHR